MAFFQREIVVIIVKTVKGEAHRNTGKHESDFILPGHL